MIALRIKVNRLLGLMGLQINRIPQEVITRFYRQEKSSQIPNLGFLYETILGQAVQGCVVEIGAYDGIYLSNSSCLIEKGWRGLLVEPVSHLAKMCSDRYLDNPMVQVLQLAVGAMPGHADLTYMDTMSSMSSDLTAEYATKKWAQPSLRQSRTLQVQVDTLDNILKNQEIPIEFDVLIIDVEGMETAVFDGFSLNYWKPTMIVVELADFHPDLVSTKKESFELAARITNSDYRVIYKDHINTIFVRNDHFQ